MCPVGDTTPCACSAARLPGHGPKATSRRLHARELGARVGPGDPRLFLGHLVLLVLVALLVLPVLFP
jgi:hypothetical protein